MTGQWRPISSFPKDDLCGVRVLLGFDFGHVCVGSWDRLEREPPAWLSERNQTLFGVSHWMPLPAAPEALAAAEKGS